MDILKELTLFDFQDSLSAFVILFVVIDMIGLTPIIIGMKQRGVAISAWRAATYSLITFIVFLFMGNMILDLFHVDISTFAF